MIRKVKPEDERDFVDVYTSAYRGLEEYAYTRKKDVRWYFRWLRKRDSEGFFTYEIEKPVGFIACDSNWFSVYEDSEVCEIHEIVVHPMWQNRGIGKSLMVKAFEYAKSRGKSLIELWVGRKNFKAIGFYRKFDFEIAGFHGVWIRMRKDLNSS